MKKPLPASFVHLLLAYECLHAASVCADKAPYQSTSFIAIGPNSTPFSTEPVVL